MDKSKATDKIEGEGSYSATADYNKRTADYLKKGNVESDAREAEAGARVRRSERPQGRRSEGQGRRSERSGSGEGQVAFAFHPIQASADPLRRVRRSRPLPSS